MQKFDPASIVLVFAGIVTGYAAGEFVKVSRSEDTWKLYVGAQGESARVRARNASATLTVTLMKTSPTNDTFAALAELDEQTGQGVTPLMLKDLDSAELVSAQEAWIVKPAEKGFGNDMPTREWTIALANAHFV